jgi:succinoglycan biosynthesis protein ExoL
VRIAYFVHDLNDAAVAKRVWMLRSAGAEVRLAGFRRTAEPVQSVAGLKPLNLGRTHDARLLSRAASVLKNLLLAPARGEFMAGVDVVMARNLEALAPAALCRALHAPRARLAYECLDVHRLMLGQGLVGKAMRAAESGLINLSSSLIVSSPAFVANYFEPFQRVSARQGLKLLLVENKAYPDLPPPSEGPAPGPPWRIGWFGMVRCRKSLDFLCDLARRRPDLVRVDIRGRPSYTEFEDFDRQTSETPGVAFGGPYAPQDLPALYGALHFNWSVDYFQDEGNSRWLLPNRLYEGGRAGAPPIARIDCETGRWLASHGLGALFERPETELEAFLDAMTPERYVALRRRHVEAPQTLFVIGPEDCERLVRTLAGEPATDQAAAALPKALLLAE